MIDLHCHILPALDDGPETEAESLQMAQVFVQSGYHTVAATPHMVPGTGWMPSIDLIKSKIDGLNQTIKDQGLSLEIVPGMEIAIDPQIPDLLDAGRLLPLGNASCLLIEPAFQQLPPGWEQVIFAIQAKGYSILLAHPERCAQLATQPNLIEKLIQSNVYMAVNWGSLLGQYGRTVARTARLIAINGWIHCLVTDSHHPDGHTPERIQAATAKLRKLIGQENLERITSNNPQCVLNGEPLQSMTPTSATSGKKKPPWWRFWK
jgi:protein-tyrosine phosphatase